MNTWPGFFRDLSMWLGIICVVFFAALWMLSSRNEFLGAAGGTWAIAQVFAGLASYAERRAQSRPATGARLRPSSEQA